LTGFVRSGSWPPTLLAISQTMNQMIVIVTHPRSGRVSQPSSPTMRPPGVDR
jgi:hypothetical protein